MTIADTSPDIPAIKKRQQATWAAGDYAVVGTTLQIVGERICEAVDLCAGERVLDVAAGNGNATLAAARRFADVTSTDYVGALFDGGRPAPRRNICRFIFQEADAENLPFADGSFDVVLSTFGVMFTPDQVKSVVRTFARDAQGRAHRPCQLDAGRFHRSAFQDHRQACAAAGGPQARGAVGHRSAVEGAFPRTCGEGEQGDVQFPLQIARPLGGNLQDLLRTHQQAFLALDAAGQKSLEADLLALLNQLNRGGSRGLIVPSEYLEIVVTKP